MTHQSRHVALVVALLCAPPAAFAGKPLFDVQLFYPSPGLQNFFTVESATVNGHLHWSGGLNINYAHNPLTVRLVGGEEDGDGAGAIVGHRVDFNLMGSVGLFGYGDLGIVMPLVAQGGLEADKFEAAGVDVGPKKLRGFTQGDLRIVPKVHVYTLWQGKLAFAVVPTVVLPTSNDAKFTGEKGFAFMPSIVASTRLDLFGIGQLRAAANLGYRIRERTRYQTITVDDEIFYKFAGGYDVAPPLDLDFPLEGIVEIFGHTGANRPFGIGADTALQQEYQKARTSMEMDLGARAPLFEHYLVTAGIGIGLLSGYGAPLPRLFASVAYFVGAAGPEDNDHDGLDNKADQCSDKAEDFDGFEDSDGCPDIDNDGDYVADTEDRCPLEGEDKDGYKDDDGCPEADNDDDGFLDGLDACPTLAEDNDGFHDDDGCPDLDNDDDGVMDQNDKCPDAKEDQDGFADDDGCPDTDNDQDGRDDLSDQCPNDKEDRDEFEDDDGCPEDNDGDGFADSVDLCGNEPEVYNGIDDADGCPEKGTAILVRMGKGRLVLNEPIHFKDGTILPASQRVLDQVAALLKARAGLTRVRVEGHTGGKGTTRALKRVAFERADAVRLYLVSQGVAEERLEVAGIGPDEPLVPENARDALTKNERIEFVVVAQQADAPKVVPEPPVLERIPGADNNSTSAPASR